MTSNGLAISSSCSPARYGLTSSQTISPAASTSIARPRSVSVISVLPLGSRWLEPQVSENRSAGVSPGTSRRP